MTASRAALASAAEAWEGTCGIAFNHLSQHDQHGDVGEKEQDDSLHGISVSPAPAPHWEHGQPITVRTSAPVTIRVIGFPVWNGTLRAEAAGLLARLHVQFPELVLMATGRRDEESSVASLVSDGRIYRFLHKPISPARGSLFLSAASRRLDRAA